MAKTGQSLMKWLWAIVALVALITGIRETINNGIEKSYPLFIITLTASAMYFFRRARQKNYLD